MKTIILQCMYRFEFAPWKVLITLVILIAFLEPMEHTSPEYQVLDFFAGAGRIAQAARAMGESTAALDIGYHSNPRVFDINSSPGFVFLGLIRYRSIYCNSDFCPMEFL